MKCTSLPLHVASSSRLLGGGGGVADGGASAAAGDAGDRVPQRQIAGRIRGAP